MVIETYENLEFSGDFANGIFEYRFRRNEINFLSWPYLQDCSQNLGTMNFIFKKSFWIQYQYFLIAGKNVRSYEDCYYKCKKELFEKIFNCTPNPLIRKGLNLIDIKSLKLDFCNQVDKEIDTKECLKKCKKGCTEVYFNIFVGLPAATNRTMPISLRFESRIVPIFHYNFEAQNTFVEFLSWIEGIISLWFNFAVIDIYIVFKKVLLTIRNYLPQDLFSDYLLEALRMTRIWRFRRIWI